MKYMKYILYYTDSSLKSYAEMGLTRGSSTGIFLSQSCLAEFLISRNI